MEQLRNLYQAYQQYKAAAAGDEFHDALMRGLREENSLEPGEYREKCTTIRWDRDWIEAFEAAIPFVEKAVEEQRRFIESFSEIRRVDQARKTTVDSIRHLAEHSNLISRVEGEDVIPDRILIVQREDNYAIYENRFLFTLVRQMQDFLQFRAEAARMAGGARQIKVFLNREGQAKRTRINGAVYFTLNQMPAPARAPGEDAEELSDGERVEMLDQRVRLLLSAPLLRQLKGCTPVTAPIVRTNVFKNNENFKQALNLFEFLQEYQKPGYEIIEDETGAAPIPPEMEEDLLEMMALETLMGRMAMDPEIAAGLREDRRLAAEEKEAASRREEAARNAEARSYAVQARREEIAIRNREIARREEIIAEKAREITAREAEIAERDRKIAEGEAEREALAARLREAEAGLRRTEEELHASQGETREALSQLEQERIGRRADLDQAKREVSEAWQEAETKVNQAQARAEQEIAAARKLSADEILKARLAAEQEVQAARSREKENTEKAETLRKEAERKQRASEQAELAAKRELRGAKEQNASLQKQLIQARQSAKKDEEPPRKSLRETARKIWNA